MTLALLCQFTSQHVSDVNTSIFRNLRLLGALLFRLYCGDLRRVGVMQRDWLLVMWYLSAGWTPTQLLCSGIGCWWCGIRVQVEPLSSEYHITNSQSRYITPKRLKSAQYSLHNNAPSSRKLLKMDVLTSETCWAVNWHNKASFIKVGLPLFKYQDDARSNTHKMNYRRTHTKGLFLHLPQPRMSLTVTWILRT